MFHKQGSFPVRKRTGTLRIWRARELKALYCRREQICHSYLLNFAAICRKGPERRPGDQKKNRNGVPARNEPCSQGSVATYARCGGISDTRLTTNLPRNLPVNFFLNRLRVDRIIAKSLWPRFWPCMSGLHSFDAVGWAAGRASGL